MVEYTQRGFRIYTHFRDRYGNEVRVQQSSLATESCVWIFSDEDPHLTVEQAQVVRDALDEFIADALHARPTQ